MNRVTQGSTDERSRLALPLVLHIDPAKLLHPLPGIDLRREDVSLAVDGDVVQRRELADLPPWPAEAAKRLLRGAVDDAHLAVHAVDHVDEFLILVGREHEVVDRARAACRLLVDMLGDESAILAEYLQAVVAAIADVDEIIFVDADAMHRVAELLRGRLCGIVGRRLFVARRFPVGAPVALVVAGFGIEHRDAPVGVAVRGKHLLRRDVDGNLRWRAESRGRIAVVALALPADLQHELALYGELEELAVLLAVAGEPDEIVAVDENPVLALRPLKALAGAAPVAEQIAGLVEYQHRRRGNAALGFGWVLLGRTLAWRKRGRPVHDPDAVISVGGDAGDLPQNPFVRQRLRPERIDLKLRHRGSTALGQYRAGDERHYGGKPRDLDFHVVLPRTARSVPSPSISTSATSPLSGAARPDAGPSSRLATLSIGVSSRKKTRSPLASLAAARSSGSTIW